MRKKFFLFISYSALVFLCPVQTNAQDDQRQHADSILQARGEIFFRFAVNERSETERLTSLISIDNVKDAVVTAYASRRQFDRFLKEGYPFEILTPPSMLISEKDLNMGRVQKDRDGKTIWNFYPTYQQYVDFMAGFAANYPDICKLDTIGTSIMGRLLLAVKISDSVNTDRGKPLFLYTSSIHGDEVTGYVLMLHLIDYLLSNYGVDPRITEMVNNTQIFINPLANPDGTYFGGNGTIYGATRFNAAGVDLNRNYPDPDDGPHPDGNPWQKETVAFMNYADSSRFSMSMNFHGGAEVFNYPWDTWSKLQADNNWFDFLGREYADTVHLYAPAGYMTFMDNGVTNGYQWYTISGGRQDYMTYFQYGREVTLEISDDKTVLPSQLLNYWEYNYRSFLNYIEQVHYGINGQVTDTLTGEPLKVKVNIFLHDFDNSHVYSRLPAGWYYRPVDAGNYTLVFSASGYYSKSIPNVSVTRKNTTRLDVQMVPLTIGGLDEYKKYPLIISPNPAGCFAEIILPGFHGKPGSLLLEMYNTTGQRIRRDETGIRDQDLLKIDLSSLNSGLYIIRILSGYNVYEGKLIKE